MKLQLKRQRKGLCGREIKPAFAHFVIMHDQHTVLFNSKHQAKKKISENSIVV